MWTSWWCESPCDFRSDMTSLMIRIDGWWKNEIGFSLGSTNQRVWHIKIYLARNFFSCLCYLQYSCTVLFRLSGSVLFISCSMVAVPFCWVAPLTLCRTRVTSLEVERSFTPSSVVYKPTPSLWDSFYSFYSPLRRWVLSITIYNGLYPLISDSSGPFGSCFSA